MHAHGWKNYWKEWWHYSFAMKGSLPHRDVPYGCWEPAEGQWTEPDAWRTPGHVMPAAVVPQPCPAPEAATNEPVAPPPASSGSR